MKINEPKFNVLLMNFNTKEVEPYNVIPYFIREWNEKYNKEERETIKTREQLKEWIDRTAKYQFWARCEYEIMIGPWPYREDKILEELKKVDAYQQITYNIDILTDILFKEFELHPHK